MYDFSGKVALITGAVSKRGMGRATALCLARDGADIAVIDLHRMHPRSAEEDRIENWKGLDSVVEEVEALGRKALAIVADHTKSQQVKEMVAKVLAKFGHIDILVNGAGIMGPYREGALDYPDEEWDAVIASNLTGPFLCSKAVGRAMVEKGNGGKIINISSNTGKLASSNRIIAYGAAKAGLINVTQTLARELAPHRINVNAICPGATASELISGMAIRNEMRAKNIGNEEATANVMANRLPNIPLGWVAQPENQADAIAFLASKQADHITGAALNIDGGHVMAP